MAARGGGVVPESGDHLGQAWVYRRPGIWLWIGLVEGSTLRLLLLSCDIDINNLILGVSLERKLHSFPLWFARCGFAQRQTTYTVFGTSAVGLMPDSESRARTSLVRSRGRDVDVLTSV